MTRQQVIIEHVHHDAGKAAALRANPRLALQHQRMTIREAINTPMQPDAAAHPFGQRNLLHRPFDKIAKQAAQGLLRRV